MADEPAKSLFVHRFWVHYRDPDPDETVWYGVLKPLPSSLTVLDLARAVNTNQVRIEEEEGLQGRLLKITGRLYNVTRQFAGLADTDGQFINVPIKITDP